MSMEIEAKFVLPAAEDAWRLARAESLAGFPLGPANTETVRDAYFDTPDRRLLAAGYALRLRRQHDGTLITAKSVEAADSAIHQREELEELAPDASPDPETWPAGPARDLVLRVTGGEPLAPLFQLKQQRTTRPVLLDRACIAKLSIDKVRVRAGSKRQAYRELEIELTGDGTEEQLQAMANVLGAEWGFKPSTQSKFERALALLQQQPAAGQAQVTEAPSPIAPDDSMSRAACKAIQVQLERIESKEQGTRAGEDPEELHDMRVATRRLRAATRVFRPFLDPQRLKPAVKRLRRAGRLLGAVRDLDVFAVKTRHYLDSLPPERQSELAPLLQAWEVEHDRARRRLEKYLDGKKYARFKETLGDLLEDCRADQGQPFSAQGEPLPFRVRTVLPGVLFDRWAAVQAYLEPLSAPDAPLKRYHRLRIAAKRLRYTLEFFEDALGPETEMLIERLKRLQDHLGDLQDAVVTTGLLRGYIATGYWGNEAKEDGPAGPPPDAEAARAYLAFREGEIKRLLETFPPIWIDVAGADFKQRLSALIGSL